MTEPVASRPVMQRRATDVRTVSDHLVVEEPLEIRLGDTPIAVVMRTPGHDDDLIRGFALTEGIALTPDEIDTVEDLGSGRFRLVLAEGVVVDPERFRRNLYATSSCGVCGKASIDAVRVTARAVRAGPVVSAATLAGLPTSLRRVQPAFDLTGGLHAAGAFTADGTLIAAREDVGRHNAVDKVVGLIASEAWPVSAEMLFVSGRVSFEIVQKAAVAGFPIVAGVSAVSTLAVELGDELGMTILGFVREDDFNLYSHPNRVGS